MIVSFSDSRNETTICRLYKLSVAHIPGFIPLCQNVLTSITINISAISRSIPIVKHSFRNCSIYFYSSTNPMWNLCTFLKKSLMIPSVKFYKALKFNFIIISIDLKITICIGNNISYWHGSQSFPQVQAFSLETIWHYRNSL